MGIQISTDSKTININMKAFVAVSALLAAATADQTHHQVIKHGNAPAVSHSVHKPHGSYAAVGPAAPRSSPGRAQPLRRREVQHSCSCSGPCPRPQARLRPPRPCLPPPCPRLPPRSHCAPQAHCPPRPSLPCCPRGPQARPLSPCSCPRLQGASL